MTAKDLPFPGPETGRSVLRAFLKQRTPLAALEIMHRDMGEIFKIPLSGFSPVVLVGPEANHFVLVTQRNDLRWRVERDPVARLLRHGVLVEDGEAHDVIRRSMLPALHKRMLGSYLQAMIVRTDQVINSWAEGSKQDMLVEMRKAALLILMDALYGVDFSLEINRLWHAILKTLEFISPGLWILWPDLPRPGYARSLAEMDRFLFSIIRERRASPGGGHDLLSLLVSIPEMSDDLIRDQLLTMMIAGHDTSTALLAWALYLLGGHPKIMRRIQDEIDDQIGDELPTLESIARLDYLDQVLAETLRMYPPIHVGNRIAAIDLEFGGYRIPAGTRVMYSIYLSHRQEKHWPEPARFDPERFTPEQNRAREPYTYVAFGGGPRNCIGLAFAKVEVKVVLARLFNRFWLTPELQHVFPYMGATLEPRPGVWMRVSRRKLTRNF
jgi:cytochrome P450